MARKSIELHKGNALAYLGGLYKNQREAAKEYISNAIDGWFSANGTAGPQCIVDIHFTPSSIRIESSGYPGMNDVDFDQAMLNVAQSLKVGALTRQVGERGIGLFAFQQFANKAIFWSKKQAGGPTWRFELRKGIADYDWQQAIRRESLGDPGVVVELSELTRSPLTNGAALHPNLLYEFLQEMYAVDLREDRLHLSLHWKGRIVQVPPPAINLEQVAPWLEAGGYVPVHGPVTGELYFEPSGTGRVSIRHKGVVIVRSVGELEPLWEGFSTSVLCTGYLEGAFDADFLTPLATRNQFEENGAWLAFGDWLQSNAPLIAEEVQDRIDTMELQRLDQVEAEARRLAGKALRSPMLRSLQLLGGTRPNRNRSRKEQEGQLPLEPTKTPKVPREPRTIPPTEEIDRSAGMAIRLLERPFPPAKRSLHSEYDGEGRIIINTQHAHYKRFVGKGQTRTEIWYEAMLIGKETVGYNFDSATDALERLTAFTCEIESSIKN